LGANAFCNCYSASPSNLTAFAIKGATSYSVSAINFVLYAFASAMIFAASPCAFSTIYVSINFASATISLYFKSVSALI